MKVEQLKEYWGRFIEPNQRALAKFYTDLDVRHYSKELPQINDIAQFNERLFEARQKKQKICIYGDYDADAVCSVSVCYLALINFGFDPENIIYYVPDRFKEGYGMNPEAVEELSTEVDLIITVDCGITSVKEVKIAKKNGADILITDHHLPGKSLPKAYAVCNPNVKIKKDDKDEITLDKENHLETSVVGAGVIWFCMLWFGYYLLEKEEIGAKIVKKHTNLLQYVAIATIADCQSVADFTNRTLIKVGISLIKNPKTIRTGILALLQEMAKNPAFINSQDISFWVSPALNAPGRIKHAKIAIELLIEDEIKTALTFARKVVEINNERKEMVKESIENIEELAAAEYKKSKYIILLGDWNIGIIGLIASRIQDKFNAPAVIASTQTGVFISASMRSPVGYDLSKAIMKISNIIEKGGGHANAAGFSARKDNFKLIKKELILEFDKQGKRNKEKVVRTKSIGGEIMEIKANHLIVESLEAEDLEKLWKMEPFGMGFPLPNMIIKQDILNIKELSGGLHMKLTTSSGLDTLIFNINNEQKELILKSQSENIPLWFSASPSINVFRNNQSNQLLINTIIGHEK